MKLRMLFLALVAVAAVGLGATGSIAAGQQGNVAYEFRGELAATPPPNSPSLLVDVAGGNKRALRLMVGQPVRPGVLRRRQHRVSALGARRPDRRPAEQPGRG